MQNDVNGIAWCMPDYFKNTGVKYLVMGINMKPGRFCPLTSLPVSGGNHLPEQGFLHFVPTTI